MGNLAIALISFILFICLVLTAARIGKLTLYCLSVTFILISNVTVQMNTHLFAEVTISWAIIVYSMVYMITDFIIEFYGRPEAYKLATVNVAVQLVLWMYVGLSLFVKPDPGTSTQVYETMRSLFGTTFQITIAAVAASLGPFLDIFITAPIREWLRKRKLSSDITTNLILRTKLSTFLGEAVNTVIFFSIALAGTGTSTSTRVSIIISAVLVKWAVSAADAPFLWLFFRFIGAPSDAKPRVDGVIA